MRLMTALRNGAIDVVIATDAGPLFDSKVLPLWSERILVALPEGHQLATKKSIYWTTRRSNERSPRQVLMASPAGIWMRRKPSSRAPT
jgi:DNA-binding transcriptional LysR family regulator